MAWSSTNTKEHGSKQAQFWRRLQHLFKHQVLPFFSKHRLHVLVGLAALSQFYLLYIAYQHHVFNETVKLNRKTLSRGGVPPADAWWRNQNLTIWTIWIGEDKTPPPVIQAAMESCRTIHQDTPNLEYRVLKNDDLQTLTFDLHPSFWLLDNVEKSDYLRGELLHHFGGFYMDADVLCLENFSGVLLNNYPAGAAQDRTKYGAWPSVSQNAFGPFRAHSEITRKWHDELYKTMDDITPTLQECAAQYAPNAIPYPTSRRWGVSLCGTEWGGVIDFMKPVWMEFYQNLNMGHDLSMCDVRGRHLGWEDYMDMKKCDIVHLGTAGDFYKKKDWDMKRLCLELPVLQASVHCQ